MSSTPRRSRSAARPPCYLDIDPVGLVRGRRPGPSLEPYVNDRPYVASSFPSSAIAEHFGTAMGGRSKERRGLAEESLPLEAGIPVLPAPGGEPVVRGLFEPLGSWSATAEHHIALEPNRDTLLRRCPLSSRDIWPLSRELRHCRARSTLRRDAHHVFSIGGGHLGDPERVGFCA
jgi:hypothetical protein